MPFTRCAGDNSTPLTFCIGGPFGHGDAMRTRANDSIRLSTMVLNHQVRAEAESSAAQCGRPEQQCVAACVIAAARRSPVSRYMP